MTSRKNTDNKKNVLPSELAVLQEIKGQYTQFQNLLQNIETTLNCLYKVQDNLFTFTKYDKSFTFYLPDLPYDFIQRNIVNSADFFEGVLLDYVREHFMHPGMRVVDVGGNIGNHAVFFSAVAEAATVTSIEPQAHMCEIFRRNMELNHLENVTLQEGLCSAEKGEGRISRLVAGNFGATGFSTDTKGGSYQALPLDERYQGECDFLKIDVEGMEVEVIRGAKNLLERCHPVIMAELWDEQHFKAFVEQIAPLGYQHYAKFGVYDYIFTREKVSG